MFEKEQKNPLFMKGVSLMVVAMLLAACGDNEAEERRERYAQMDDAAITSLMEAGKHREALDAIKTQIEREIANRTDYLNLAHIHLTFLDGIAAEAAIERARILGAPRSETALMLARASMLQNRPEKARQVLSEVDLVGNSAFEATILRGDIEKELGDDKGARYFYRTAMDIRPDDFRGYLGMAMLALGQGKLADAEEWAAQAASKVADDSIVRYVRGTVARYQQRPDEAEAHLRQAVKLHTANLLAHFELVALLIETGQLDEAQSALDVVYERAPESPMAHYYSALALAAGGKMKEAEHLLLRIGDLTRRYPPAARAYGHVLFKLEKYSTARPYLERVLARLPADRRTRLALAECLTRRGDAARALGLLRLLLDGDQNDLDARLLQAAAYAALGQIPETREALRDAQEIAGKRGPAGEEQVNALAQHLALTRFIEGDEKGAVDELMAFYKDKPKDKESLVLLANLQLESGDIAGAEATAGQVVVLDPGGAESANLLGAVRLRQGRFEEALDLIDKALERSPEYQSALKNRGVVYLGLKRFDDAKKDFEHLVEKGVQDGQVMAMLGRAYLELGRASEANRYLKVAAEIIPESAIIATDLAEALAQSGYRSSAVAQARVARRLASRDPGLEIYIDDLIVQWQREEAEAAELAEEQAAADREKRAQALAERKKKREALLKDYGIDKDEPEEAVSPDDPPADAPSDGSTDKPAEESEDKPQDESPDGEEPSS